MNVLQSFRKTQLRHNVREKLNLLTFDKIEEKSRVIYERLITLDSIINSDTVFIYVSLQDEVQTFDIIKYLQNLGKIVLVPKIVGSDLKVVKLNPKTKLVPGKYGILEPKENDIYDGEIDVALVPGLAFSSDGKRLGKGGGYYDKLFFLDNIKYKIGICFDFQLLEDCEIPLDDHDVLMDIVITDK